MSTGTREVMLNEFHVSAEQLGLHTRTRLTNSRRQLENSGLRAAELVVQPAVQATFEVHVYASRMHMRKRIYRTGWQYQCVVCRAEFQDRTRLCERFQRVCNL